MRAHPSRGGTNFQMKQTVNRQEPERRLKEQTSEAVPPKILPAACVGGLLLP